MLTASGLEATEYNCEFLQVSKSKLSPGWLVGALCEEPDQLFPDLLTIREMSPTELDLVSIKLVDPATGGGNSGTYYLCEGVARRRRRHSTKSPIRAQSFSGSVKPFFA